jgi:hypothetical protein
VTAFSLHCWRKGWLRDSVLGAALTLPLGLLASVAGWGVHSLYQVMRPNSPEFKAACQSATVRYLSTPLRPIKSIAYDWAADTSPPPFSYIGIGWNGGITDTGSGTSYLPRSPQLVFTETKCCRYGGPPSNGMPYVREPRDGRSYGVNELTADALVTFKRQRVGEQTKNSALTQIDIEVTDRRDGQLLATMRYFFDDPRRRACGEVYSGAISESAFVLKALDLERPMGGSTATRSKN